MRVNKLMFGQCLLLGLCLAGSTGFAQPADRVDLGRLQTGATVSFVRAAGGDWSIVTTPEVSKEKAVVKITSEVRNTSPAEADVVVRPRVLDAKDKTVKATESKLHLPAHEKRQAEQLRVRETFRRNRPWMRGL